MSQPVRVTIWNEFLHELNNDTVRKVYPHGIHHRLAEGIADYGDFDIRTATLREPAHGLGSELLDETDVLIWWGHAAHQEVSDETTALVQQKVLEGMGFVALHSAHFSKPFQRLMGTNCSLKWREADEKERLWNLQPSHPIMGRDPRIRRGRAGRDVRGALRYPRTGRNPDDLMVPGWRGLPKCVYLGSGKWQGRLYPARARGLSYLSPAGDLEDHRQRIVVGAASRFNLDGGCHQLPTPRIGPQCSEEAYPRPSRHRLSGAVAIWSPYRVRQAGGPRGFRENGVALGRFEGWRPVSLGSPLPIRLTTREHRLNPALARPGRVRRRGCRAQRGRSSPTEVRRGSLPGPTGTATDRFDTD